MSARWVLALSFLSSSVFAANTVVSECPSINPAQGSDAQFIETYFNTLARMKADKNRRAGQQVEFKDYRGIQSELRSQMAEGQRLRLPFEEFMAVVLYTLHGYEQLNGTFDETGSLVPKALCPAQQRYRSILNRALSRLPAYRCGTLYHGNNLGKDQRGIPSAQVRKDFAKGNAVVIPSYLSTTSDPEQALMFGSNRLRINSCRSGRDIAKISYAPSEQEILFPPGTCFQVSQAGVPITQAGGTSRGFDFYLDEVACR